MSLECETVLKSVGLPSLIISVDERPLPGRVGESGQSIGVEGPEPRSGRVIAPQESLPDRLAAPPLAQEHQRVCPSGQTMLDRPVPSPFGQVLAFLVCQKAAAHHGAKKNPSAPTWQAVFAPSYRAGAYRSFVVTIAKAGLGKGWGGCPRGAEWNILSSGGWLSMLGTS